MKGWDFSRIEGRYESDDDLPWDYRGVINQYLRPESEILDSDQAIDSQVERFRKYFDKLRAEK